MKVKHKQTGEELTVSPDYYHKYQGRLDIVSGKEDYEKYVKKTGVTQTDIEKAISDSKLADAHDEAVKEKKKNPPKAPKAPPVEPKEGNDKLVND